MRRKAAVFSGNPIGDGINMLVLSNNLYLNGFEVDTYQDTFLSMQQWFPHLPICPYPPIGELPKILEGYDLYFVFRKQSEEFLNQLIKQGKERFPEKVKVIYVCPSKNIANEIYYKDCLTNSHLSFAENLCVLCEKVMRFPIVNKSNGMVIPKELEFRKFDKRIVIHPTSSKVRKNWPKKKFVKLALQLQSEGFEPVFVPGPEEIEDWKDLSDMNLKVEEFPSLDALARFIYESGYFIGNDSGPGHLASSLGIKTMTFFSRKVIAKLWAPGLTRNIALTPSSWIPNISGLRFRDKYWHKFISVARARRCFADLLKNG